MPAKKSAPQALHGDATFNDFAFPPRKAGTFLGRVQTEMFKATKAYGGDIVARMEISGTAAAPIYRLERDNGKPLMVMNGVGHKRLADDAQFEGTQNWSSATMSFKEVSEAALSAFSEQLSELQLSSRKRSKAKGTAL